jgi:hypothetical protein
MSTYICHRASCEVEIDEEQAEWEEKSGRAAYCSDACFSQTCSEESQFFNDTRDFGFTYVVGDPTTEDQLLSILKQRNPYIVESFDEGTPDEYPGGWHWVWIPDLEDLKEAAAYFEVDDLADVHFGDWEEFLCFAHPVRGIALIQAMDSLSAMSVSFTLSNGKVDMTSSPSEPDFQK